MKKYIKKLCLVAIAIASCAIAFVACSPDDEEDKKKLIADASLLTYEIVDGEAIVSGCNGFLEGELTIPSTVTIDGVAYPVVGLGENAFVECRITDLIVPEGVRFIEDLFGLRSLSSIVVPNSLEKFELDVISICENEERSEDFKYNEYNGVKYIGNDTNPYVVAFDTVSDDIERFSLHKDTKIIASGAFEECDNITDVTIPDSVIYISHAAFYDCKGIKTAMIPDSVMYIGYYLFGGCDRMESITLPFIGRYLGEGDYHVNVTFDIFGNDIPESLKTVTLTAEVNLPSAAFTSWRSEDENGVTRQYGCYNIENIILPDTLITIGDHAFSGCDSLKNVNISDGVTTIGDQAFNGCENLTSIVVPNSVTMIGEDAFGGCRLESLTVPFVGKIRGVGESETDWYYGWNNLSHIMTQEDLKSLKHLTITDDTKIAQGALRECDHLESLSVPFIGASADSENTYLGYFWGGENNESHLTDLLPESLQHITLTSGTKVGGYSFRNCRYITKITLPDTIVEIGECAFNSCVSLTSINIPNGVTTVGEYAFLNCNKLETLTIPDSVTTIGDGAFSVLRITSLIIPANVKTMGEGVFSECTYLTNVTIERGAKIGVRTFAFCDGVYQDDKDILSTLTYSGTISEWVDVGKPNWYGDSNITKVICLDGEHTVRRL